MYFILDSVSPARVFLRGIKYRSDVDFPEYGGPQDGYLTETDAGPDGLMPIAPWEQE